VRKAAKVIENTQRDVNIALIMSSLSSSIVGYRYEEVLNGPAASGTSCVQADWAATVSGWIPTT